MDELQRNKGMEGPLGEFVQGIAAHLPGGSSTQTVVVANYTAIILALAGIIALMVLKFEGDGIAFIMSNNLAICNLAFTSMCTLFNLTGMVVSTWHLMRTWHAQWYDAHVAHMVVHMLLFSQHA